MIMYIHKVNVLCILCCTYARYAYIVCLCKPSCVCPLIIINDNDDDDDDDLGNDGVFYVRKG